MLLVYSLFAAALLGASDVTTSSIQQALPQGTPSSVCEQGNEANKQGSQEAYAFIGVISEVDYSKGLVTVETDAGKLRVAASPKDLANLQEGDILVLCATEEVPVESPILKEPFIT